MRYPKPYQRQHKPFYYFSRTSNTPRNHLNLEQPWQCSAAKEISGGPALHREEFHHLKNQPPFAMGGSSRKAMNETKVPPCTYPGVVSEILSTAPHAEDQGLPGQAVILTNSILQGQSLLLVQLYMPSLGVPLLWQEELLHDSNHMEAEKGKCCFSRPFQPKN